MRPTGPLGSGVVPRVLTTITTWREFTVLPTANEDPPGTWTFDESVWAEGVFLVPPGTKVIGGENSVLSSLAVSGGTWIFNVDAPAFSGPLNIQKQVVVQQSAGSSSACVLLSTTAGRVPTIILCQLIGGVDGALIFDNIQGVAASIDVLSSQSGRGTVFRGILGSISVRGFSTNLGQPGFIACEVEPSANIVPGGGLLFVAPNFMLGAGHFGFAISASTTINSPELIQIQGAGNTGDQGTMLRQTNPGVTDMDRHNDALVIVGGPSVSNWKASAVAQRFDASDPLIVDILAANTDTLIPYEDAAGNTEIEASTENHITFFKGAGVTDWHFEYTGSLEGGVMVLPVELQAERSSAGPSQALVKWQRDTVPYGAWTDVEDSEAPWENTNRLKARTSFASFDGLVTGDRFRPVAQDSGGVDIRLAELRMSPSASH